MREFTGRNFKNYRGIFEGKSQTLSLRLAEIRFSLFSSRPSELGQIYVEWYDSLEIWKYAWARSVWRKKNCSMYTLCIVAQCVNTYTKHKLIRAESPLQFEISLLTFCLGSINVCLRFGSSLVASWRRMRGEIMEMQIVATCAVSPLAGL